MDLCCEVATLEHMMASEGNGWPVNHANSTNLRYGNSKTPAISLFVLQEDDLRRTQLSVGTANGRSGRILHEKTKSYGGSHHLATSARGVLGWSLCTVELVPAAMVVQMRRLGGNPDRNSRKATSTTVSAACRMVLRSKKPPRVAVMCMVWIVRNGRASIGTGASPA